MRIIFILLLVFLILFLPGFLVSWQVGAWRRSRTGRSWRQVTLRALVIGAITGLFFAGGFCYWIHTLFIPTNDDHSQRPLTFAEARRDHCPIDLPNSARNIQWQSICEQVAPVWEVRVRFEAPLADCRAAAKGLHPGVQPLPRETNMLDQPIPWFDVANIVHGETGGSNPTFWIDDDRGVFYYLETD